MFTVHTSVLLFKDKRIRSQVLTCTSTLAFTFDQFHSSWGPGPNHIPMMRTGLSLQQKSPNRGTPLFQASLLSKLILARTTSSYLTTTFFTAFLSRRRDIKTVISSVYTKTFALRKPAKETPRRVGSAPSSLSLDSRGSKARTKLSPKIDGQPCQRIWTDLNWSAQLQCRLLTPLGPREPNSDCLVSIFPSRRSSTHVWLDRWWQSANGSLRPGPKSLTLCLSELWAFSYVCLLSSIMWSHSW